MTAVQEEIKQSTLHVMDSTGDSRFMWDPANQAEVDAAKQQFNALKGQGYLAYTVKEDGSSGEVIHDFDPQASAIVMQPQLVGG